MPSMKIYKWIKDMADNSQEKIQIINKHLKNHSTLQKNSMQRFSLFPGGDTVSTFLWNITLGYSY